MGSILLCTIPKFTCSSPGRKGSTFSSIGRRHSSEQFTLPLPVRLQRYRKRIYLCAENGDGNNFISPEDVSYVWKLASACIAGAVVIKYGSIFLPDITRPNITQALFMIGIPILTSILLLLWASSMQKQK